MKLGTENKKETIIAGVLMVLAVAALMYQFSGGSSESAPVQNAAPPTSSTGVKNAHKPRTLMAHSLDPTLRFDLLKSSEDVTYKGNGRNIFSSQAPPPEIPKPIAPAMPGPKLPRHRRPLRLAD